MLTFLRMYDSMNLTGMDELRIIPYNYNHYLQNWTKLDGPIGSIINCHLFWSKSMTKII